MCWFRVLVLRCFLVLVLCWFRVGFALVPFVGFAVGPSVLRASFRVLFLCWFRLLVLFRFARREELKALLSPERCRKGAFAPPSPGRGVDPLQSPCFFLALGQWGWSGCGRWASVCQIDVQLL